MNRAAEGTLVVGGAIKGFLLGVGSLVVTGYGVYSLFTGHVLRGLLIIFIAEPIWLLVADIATGLILAVLVLVAGFLGWGLKRRGAGVAPVPKGRLAELLEQHTPLTEEQAREHESGPILAFMNEGVSTLAIDLSRDETPSIDHSSTTILVGQGETPEEIAARKGWVLEDPEDQSSVSPRVPGSPTLAAPSTTSETPPEESSAETE